MVATYLRAVAGTAEDRGWSLLDPELRSDAFDSDEAAYVRLAEDANWSRFVWTLDGAGTDGDYWQYAYIVLPGGRDSVPTFLVNSGDMAVVDIVGVPHEARRARIPIRRDASGRWWIFAYDVVSLPSFPPVHTGRPD